MFIIRFGFAKICDKVQTVVQCRLTASSFQQRRTVSSVAARENEPPKRILMRIRCRKKKKMPGRAQMGSGGGGGRSVSCNTSRPPVDGDTLAYFT